MAADPGARAVTELPGETYRRYVLGLLAVVYVFNFTDRQILAVLLQPIKEELLVSDTQLGFLSGIAFALFYVTLGIPIARLADRSNRVEIISGAIALWSVMTALSGLATSFMHLMVARIGVGVGEAGCTPPAHSLLSDYFSNEERSGALGVYSLGLPVGGFLGIMLGGWVGQLLGWRAAFFIVGVPGLVLAVLVRMSVREPLRGMADGRPPSDEPAPAIRDVLRFVWSRRSFRHATLGTALLAAVGFASATWIPPFLYRTHAMRLGEIGTWLSAITVVGGVAGTLGGGFLGDRLAPRDARWYVWMPALALLIGVPFSIAGLLAQNRYVAIALWLIPTISYAIYVGPVMAMIQRMVGLRMRALAVAVFLFCTNLIGMGGGPLAIGFASDLMTKTYGSDSLRYALLGLGAVTVWAAVHYVLAGRTIVADLTVSRT
jgi:predicted MFS family arabinose efflux permease